ncbi:hypothetical protein EV702DRAFT_1044789 [Suillus placidus]|uniref:Uncharacterized protein n=1 Tax=Suillus placidus TaxID=48579 RepID=A0A9P6ZXR6_9AGAM|nr:hypothetical protein EV702DRAFT_1044789 [Suillus placidus]
MRYEKDGGPPGGIMTISKDDKTFTLNSIKYLYQDNTFTSKVTGFCIWYMCGLNKSIKLKRCHSSQYVYHYFKDTKKLGLYLGSRYHTEEVIILMAGQVSNVWFLLHSSYELLKDKPPGWAVEITTVIQLLALVIAEELVEPGKKYQAHSQFEEAWRDWIKEWVEEA